MRMQYGNPIAAAAITFLVLIVAPESGARDTKNMWSVADAMNAPEAKAQLTRGIKFYFGESAHPPVAKSFGMYQSNKKTRGVGRTDKEACDWAFLSAMVSFQQRAIELGADAVVKIESYYREVLISHATEYQCGSGALMSGVTFRGEIVKLQ